MAPRTKLALHGGSADDLHAVLVGLEELYRFGSPGRWRRRIERTAAKLSGAARVEIWQPEAHELYLRSHAVDLPGRHDTPRRAVFRCEHIGHSLRVRAALLAPHLSRAINLLEHAEDHRKCDPSRPRVLEPLGFIEHNGRRMLVLEEHEPADTRIQLLTTAQRQVVSLVLQGLGNKAIARRLRCAQRTVANHLQSVYRLIGVSNRVTLMNRLLEPAGRIASLRSVDQEERRPSANGRRRRGAGEPASVSSRRSGR